MKQYTLIVNLILLGNVSSLCAMKDTIRWAYRNSIELSGKLSSQESTHTYFELLKVIERDHYYVKDTLEDYTPGKEITPLIAGIGLLGIGTAALYPCYNLAIRTLVHGATAARLQALAIVASIATCGIHWGKKLFKRGWDPHTMYHKYEIQDKAQTLNEEQQKFLLKKTHKKQKVLREERVTVPGMHAGNIVTGSLLYGLGLSAIKTTHSILKEIIQRGVNPVRGSACIIAAAVAGSSCYWGHQLAIKQGWYHDHDLSQKLERIKRIRKALETAIQQDLRVRKLSSTTFFDPRHFTG